MGAAFQFPLDFIKNLFAYDSLMAVFYEIHRQFAAVYHFLFVDMGKFEKIAWF